jgi:nucleoside phosphorylase
MQNEEYLSKVFPSVDFLIVTAIPEERDAILRLLDQPRKVRIDSSLICFLSTIPLINREGEYRVAVTLLSEMGNVEAGIHTIRAISALRPNHVLMVGIAAGLKEKVHLGDVIISTQIIYVEQAKLVPTGPEARPLAQQADPDLLAGAKNYNDMNWRKLISVKRPQEKSVVSLGTEFPQIHFGPFVIVEGVMANKELVDDLKRYHSKIIGIEMESYGACRAAFSAPERPAFLSIRGVSDYGDTEKDDDWHEYASASAAAFTIGFLRYGSVVPARSHRKSGPAPKPVARALIAIRHLSLQYIQRRTLLDSLPPELQDRDIVELLIDQTDLYKNGRLVDPCAAVLRQANVDQVINQLLVAHPDAGLTYFGIAHIPLLFHFGYQLSNKRRLRFFEYKRYDGTWDQLQSNDGWPELKQDGLTIHPTKDAGDVVIRISISNTIALEEVQEIVPRPIASLHLFLQPPKRDVVVCERQLQVYGARFREMLDQIHELLPNRQRVHLFYAGPVSLAIYFGQLITQTIDRRIVVYNYTGKDTPRYSWAFEITEDVDSDLFLHRITNPPEEIDENV